MASKAAIVRSTDLTEPDTATKESEGLLHSSREQEIRNRAYEIYLQRGGLFGHCALSSHAVIGVLVDAK